MSWFTSLWSKSRQASPPQEQEVREVLKQLSILQAPVGRDSIHSLNISGNKVHIKLQSKPIVPRARLERACIEAIQSLPSHPEVTVDLDMIELKKTSPTASSSPSKKTAPQTNHNLSQISNIIAVASGKGGVGKSTTTVGLAFALKAQGYKVGIVDSDIYGPSIPTMMTLEVGASMDGEEIIPAKSSGISVISMAMFAQPAAAQIMRGPMAGNMVRQFLTQVQWGQLDYLLIDYPPGTGDIQLTISQTLPLTGAVMVTTPQQVAISDVQRAMDMFKTLKVPLLGILTTMSSFVCDGCDKHHKIFSGPGGEDIAKDNHMEFLGNIPIDPQIAQSGDSGSPVGLEHPESPTSKAYLDIAQSVVQQARLAAPPVDGLQSFSLTWS